MMMSRPRRTRSDESDIQNNGKAYSLNWGTPQLESRSARDPVAKRAGKRLVSNMPNRGCNIEHCSRWRGGVKFCRPIACRTGQRSENFLGDKKRKGMSCIVMIIRGLGMEEDRLLGTAGTPFSERIRFCTMVGLSCVFYILLTIWVLPGTHILYLALREKENNIYK
jgi:hypothetical protein